MKKLKFLLAVIVLIIVSSCAPSNGDKLSFSCTNFECFDGTPDAKFNKWKDKTLGETMILLFYDNDAKMIMGSEPSDPQVLTKKDSYHYQISGSKGTMDLYLREIGGYVTSADIYAPFDGGTIKATFKRN